MAPTTARQDPAALSVVSKKWDAENKGFLTDEERALRNLDTEGTGTLSSKQLSSFAEQYGALRKENKQIKRGLVCLAILLVLFFVMTIVASVVVTKANRDTATDRETGVMRASGTDSPVSVNTNELPLPLAALPFLPTDVAEHVKTLSFAGPADGVRYLRNVKAIDVVRSARLVVKTTDGDTLVWPSAEGTKGELTVTLADGTSWNLSAQCTNCVATNVLATEENEQGIEAFLDDIGVEHTLGIGEPGTRGRRLYHSSYCGEKPSQRAALEALYFATGGDRWTSKISWLSSDNYCHWAHVDCDDYGNVESLTLDSNNLVGTIPTEIGDLTQLMTLGFLNNPDLVGTIPTQIGSLLHLDWLEFASTKMSGTIPTQIGSLQKLEAFLIKSTNIHGTIPTQIGSLQKLRAFDIESTNMSGTIPNEMGNCAKLGKFYFGDTSITGDIPDGLCDLFSTGGLQEILGGRVSLRREYAYPRPNPNVVAECKAAVI